MGAVSGMMNEPTEGVSHEVSDGEASLVSDHLEGALRAKALDGGARVVERVATAQLFAKAVLDACQLQHHAHRPT